MRTLLLVPLAATLGYALPASAAPPADQSAMDQESATSTGDLAISNQSATGKVAGIPTGSCEPVRVHFAFDKSVLTADNKSALDRSATCLSQHPKEKVSIQGNADERGSKEYNQRLGERRAQAVISYLTS
jgi:peptidoglycan-associated lipoprotein